ncbi:bacteriochlorophyll 4-vinyl reductase [Roseovarius phycicola]|uniref:Bacteriochlorophyll 4-vinyl reductase n=1 Tax=Roseovarius phycicola TaxID=3080976 RepID=A0ABZ2HEZ2_9RHOB
MDDLVQPKIGADAILQTLDALSDVGGDILAQKVLEAAGLRHMLDQKLQEMVPQNIFLALVRAIENTLPRSQVDLVAVSSGRKTGDVLLEQYIPDMAQKLLHTLPPHVAGPLLLQALEKHAWTFAGSAHVHHLPGPPLQLVIKNNPMAVWGCLWQCALLENVFRSLISADARVWHMACCADHKPSCVYMIEI